MKVLHVSSGNLYGGVEALLATLSRERTACPEMEPAFALCFPGRLSARLAELGTPAADLGSIQTRYPWQIWRARRRLARRLRAQPVDVVVCHMAWSQAIFGPVVRRARLPLVYWMHDVAEGTHWIERWAARCPPDLAICNSRFTAGSLARLFPRATPPHEVIFYPVSRPAPAVVDRAAVRAALDTPGDACVLIQVSRMEPYKGAALHLDALARLADVPGWVCWIVGGVQRPHEAAFLADLQARATRAGIAGRIRFLGQREDVPALLAAADVFCQPNLRGEPFGIVFIEAMHAGLPVVSTALGGALEIIDESCGRLVPPGDPAALADTLRNLLGNTALWERLGQNGPTHAQDLSDPPACSPSCRAVFSPADEHQLAIRGIGDRRASHLVLQDHSGRRTPGSFSDLLGDLGIAAGGDARHSARQSSRCSRRGVGSEKAGGTNLRVLPGAPGSHPVFHRLLRGGVLAIACALAHAGREARKPRVGRWFMGTWITSSRRARSLWSGGCAGACYLPCWQRC